MALTVLIYIRSVKAITDLILVISFLTSVQHVRSG